MPKQIVKQPNGLYAQFSTVVDDFVYVDMSKDEVRQVMINDAIAECLRLARRQLTRADGNIGDSWNDLCRTRRLIHGDEDGFREMDKELKL